MGAENYNRAMMHSFDHMLQSVAIAWGDVPNCEVYPFAIPAIRKLESLALDPYMTIFVGDNGSGKSTLLEAIAIACGLNPEGGDTNVHYRTRDSHSGLHEYIRRARGVRQPSTAFFLRAESYYNFASRLEELDDDPDFAGDPYGALGGKSLHGQSHGESFWSLMYHRMWPGGLFFLDEPEAALSPNRQLAALARMYELCVEGAQFVMATHSPILMAFPNARLYQFSVNGIERIEYEDTEHFQVTRDFLNHYRASVRELCPDPREGELFDDA